MSKLSKKAILSVLSLVLTFVALGATTFAWFSLGTTATVNPFEVGVKGSEGLEMSFQVGENEMGQLEWFTTINSTRMGEYLFTGNDAVFKDGKLDAVTTKDGKNFKIFDGVNENGKVVTKDVTLKDLKYLEFTLNFRTKMEDQELNLSDVNFASESVEWKSDIKFTNENNVEVEVDQKLKLLPHYAARVSFVEKDADTDAVAFQAGTDTDIGDAMTNIGFDLVKGAHNYLATKWGVDNNKLNHTSNEAEIAYAEAAKVWGTNTDELDSLVTFKKLTNQSDDDKYFYASVTVRVWLEGWDGNTYDAIFDGKFSVGFAFELSTKED